MIANTIDMNVAYDEGIERVIGALSDEGFGVITRIDLHKTFAEKLGVEFRRYTILGACNPRLAHTAVSEAPEIGLLLPCNVTVEETEGGTRVRIPDAEEMLGSASVDGGGALEELAKDAGARLARVSDACRG